MRHAVIAAFVGSVVAVPFDRRPGRFNPLGEWNWPEQEDADTDYVVETVTIHAPGLAPTAETSRSDAEADPVTATAEVASPRSSVTSQVVPSITATGAVAYTTPEDNGQPPAYEPTAETGPATTGSNPFQYPSGIVSVDGYEFTYSAPTETMWTGSVNSAEHATTYTVTPESQPAFTTSTIESACTTAASQYVRDAVDGHNEKRAIHSANPVVWDDNLACIAQRQAETCIWDHLTYVSGGGYGQNLAGGTDMADSVEMWYNEVGNFTDLYGQQSAFSKATGHFTQMVWAYSTSVGCATYDCGGGNGQSNSATGALTICNYFGQGNKLGFFGVYVLPPTDSYP